MTTNEQRFLIADLIRTIRPGWDSRGITAALEHVANRDVAECVWAAIRAAQNPDNRKPSTIGNAENWPRTPETQRRADRDAQIAAQQAARNCPDCNDLGYIRSTGARCPHDGLSQEQRDTQARQHAAQARARIRPAPQRLDRDPDQEPT